MRPKALTAYYYPGDWIHFNAARTVHTAQCTISTPQGAFLAWYSSLYNNGAGKFIHNSLSPPTGYPCIYTPGSRAAMWINCLAEGQNCRGDGEIRTRALSVRVE